MNNIIVWVLMTYSHGGSATPTMEFNTQEKCERAAISMVKQTEQKIGWLSYMKEPFCVKIEK